MENKIISNLNLQFSSTNPSSPPSSSDLNTIQNVPLGKPLSELTVDEVGRVLESIKFDEYKAVLMKNKIDGRCLMECNTIEDVKEMGIPMKIKSSLFLHEIRKWKTSGVPMEYLDDPSNPDEEKLPLVSCLFVAISMAYMLIVLY